MRLALTLLLGLGACATVPGSYVSPDIAEADVPALAQGIAGFVSLRGGSGPITINPPPGDTRLAPEVDRALRNVGLAVAPGGARLTYQVDTRPNGALLRMSLDGARGARAFSRTANGTLAPVGPYTLMLAETGR